VDALPSPKIIDMIYVIGTGKLETRFDQMPICFDGTLDRSIINALNHAIEHKYTKILVTLDSCKFIRDPAEMVASLDGTDIMWVGYSVRTRCDATSPGRTVRKRIYSCMFINTQLYNRHLDTFALIPFVPSSIM
jgi:hypothetical protein